MKVNPQKFIRYINFLTSIESYIQRVAIFLRSKNAETSNFTITTLYILMLEGTVRTDIFAAIFFLFFRQFLLCIRCTGENYPKNEQKQRLEKVEECNLHANWGKKRRHSSFIEQNCANRKIWIRGGQEEARK